MNNGTLRAPVRAIKGLLRIAPKTEVRYYLNGVLLDFKAKLAVVTDGKILLAWNCDIDGEGSAIIPRDLLEDACRGAGKEFVQITVAERDITIIGHATRKGETVNGQFPDWRACVPKAAPTGEASQFDPSLLATFQAALTDISGGKAPVQFALMQNGNYAAEVFSGACYGLIMPIRQTAPAPDRARFSLPEYTGIRESIAA